MLEIVLATTNIGKLAELQDAFADLPIFLKSLADFDIVEVVETGSTFAENAAIKAIGYAKQISRPTLADDSGLEVDALEGRPGVLSARYGGDVGYDEKIAKLLAEIAPDAPRTARFKCAIALASSSGALIANVEEACEGLIANEPRGSHGFGYDPIFVPRDFDKTFGELADDVKRSISHRAHASLAIKPYLRRFIRFST